jgi:hypothetical protein
MIHIEFNPHKEYACQRIGCMLVKMDNISLMLQQEIGDCGDYARPLRTRYQQCRPVCIYIFIHIDSSICISRSCHPYKKDRKKAASSSPFSVLLPESLTPLVSQDSCALSRDASDCGSVYLRDWLQGYF